jgi:benzodiazapine receptor
VDDQHRRRTDLVGTAALVAVTLTTAIVGSLTGDFRSAWYQQLRKPAWQPSGAVIGAVWSILYALTALSASLLWWRRNHAKTRVLWWLLALQYGFNVAFTPLFTRLHALRLAALDSALLTLSVTTLALLAWPIRRLAALLLVPYVLWTAFATVLSWRLWQLNR